MKPLSIKFHIFLVYQNCLGIKRLKTELQSELGYQITWWGKGFYPIMFFLFQGTVIHFYEIM